MSHHLKSYRDNNTSPTGTKKSIGKQVPLLAVCYYIGLVKLAVWWRQRFSHRVIILNYHRAAGNLRRHLLYLRRHYRILHLEEALDELYTSGKSEKHTDRRTILVLTFDDGYHDNYTHAFFLARELQVPITLFINPGYINSDNCFWWQAGDCLVEQAQVDKATIEGCTYDLNQQMGRTALVQVIYTRARDAQSVAEREAFLKMVRKELAIPSVVLTENEAILSWEEVHEMEQSGWVSFGAHTMHHPVLAYLKDLAEVQYEVSESRTVIEQKLGHPVRTFAYPLGRAEHIGKAVPRTVQEAGYTWAVTTMYGINTPKSNPLQLRRIIAEAEWHWLLVAADVAGIRKFFKPQFIFGKTMLLAWQTLLNSMLTLLRLEQK